MPSPEKRSCSAPPDNRQKACLEDTVSGHRSSSVDRKSTKYMTIEMIFLDESTNVYKITHKSMAKSLFNQVCETLNLIEMDYFGIEYVDSNGTRYWLDMDRAMCRQLCLSSTNVVMYFGVKFYAPDPSRLEDELTRYLFSLQIKKDLSEGLLVCNENTAALMASYIIQAEIGDFNSDEYMDHLYVSRFKLIPLQDEEFEWRVMENHKKHLGQLPAEADYNLLETARRCEMYGIKLTPVKDHEGVPLNLSVAHLGVIVFQNQTKVNTFSWAKVRKLSFKRKRFLIKLHQEEYFGDVVEFVFEGRNECKNFWKKCIEQHSFFRCIEIKRTPKQKPKIFSRGSSFRYSGRTQQQMLEYVRQSCVKRQPFQRSNSLRTSNVNNERIEGMSGSCISVTPIVPMSSPHLSSANAISDDERPKSAQEISSQKSNIFPETPPSPSIDDRSHVRTSGEWSCTRFTSREGFTSPDLMDVEADDISNDSYLIDKDIKSLSNKVSQNSVYISFENNSKNVDNLIDFNEPNRDNETLLPLNPNTDCQTLDNSKSISVDIEYVLHKRKVRQNTHKNKDREDKKRRAVSAPRIRCKQTNKDFESYHTLFARTHRFSDRQPVRKNVHFVSLSSLPSFESYSSRDDTIQDSQENAFLDNISSYSVKKCLKESGFCPLNSNKTTDSGIIHKPNEQNNEQMDCKPKFKLLSDEIVFYNLQNYTYYFNTSCPQFAHQICSENDSNPNLVNNLVLNDNYLVKCIIQMHLNERFADDFDPNCVDSTLKQTNGIICETLSDNLQNLIINIYLRSIIADNFVI